MIIPRDSRWLGWRKQKPVTLIVVGIWAMGGGATYRPIKYELQPEGTDEIITLPVDEMIKLIETKKLTRTYV